MVAFWARFGKHFEVFFDEILVVARNAPTLRKYCPCQQNQGSEPQLGDDFSNKNAYKNHPKKLIKFWMDFGRILEAKWKVLVAKILSKIDVFLGRFSEGYLNIDGAASGAATGAASGVLSAADAPGERHFIKDYSIITHQNTICTLEVLERGK